MHKYSRQPHTDLDKILFKSISNTYSIWNTYFKTSIPKSKYIVNAIYTEK